MYQQEMVRDLCELAQWAPNHKRTWPWRFAFAEGEARARLGEVIADAMEAKATRRGRPRRRGRSICEHR